MATVSAAPGLADRYEALRAARTSGAERVCERGLLMARGMVGWMHAVLAALPASDEVVRRKSDGGATLPAASGQLPDALHAQATQLLASMLLANHAEDRA